MIYRREIDGLRAVAVVPVILFHAGLTLFSGGYVGVDVFFVISGYLITSILIGELEQGDFSIARFYERRARRILPALFFVMLCCIPFAWMWMLPGELKDFSQSVVAVVFFASNILFWREEGYFAPAAELKPLLHTWSLAVEEQYYMLFPIFLLLAWRFGRNRVFWSICVIAAISLAASEWGWRNRPSANFYLAPTRAWELLAGSMSAFWLSNREQRANNLLSLIGLALIVFAIFYYDDATPFPSAYAFTPVLGAVLIIVFGGTGTWTAKLLSMPGFVGIGLISYSAYLWHQPLFAFARIRSILDPSPYLMATLAPSSLLLAYLSWRYVEKPFRNRASITQRRLVLSLIATYLCALALTLVVYVYSARQEDRDISEFLRFGEKYWKECLNFGGFKRNDFVENPCIYRTMIEKSNNDIILIGDSHAQVLHFDIANKISKPANIILYAGGSCPPFYHKLDSDCAVFHKKSAEYARNKFDIKYVILSARWSVYTRNTPFYMKNGDPIDTLNPFIKSKNSEILAKSEIYYTIQYWLSMNKKVIFVTDYPNNGRYIYNINNISKKFGYISNEKIYSLERKYYDEWTSIVKSAIIKFKNNPNFFAIDSFHSVCGETENCKLIQNGKSLLSDTNHASIEGRKRIARDVAEIINQNM